MKIFKSKSKFDKIYFVVMVNIFCTELTIRERYDLKGSLHGRTSREKNSPPPYIFLKKYLEILMCHLKILIG